jgi:hypothetical protein
MRFEVEKFITDLSVTTTDILKHIIVIASNRQQNSLADPKRDQLARMRST